MTIDRASVERAIRFWPEAPDYLIELLPELALELQRLWRVEEAAQHMDLALDRAERLPRDSWFFHARGELRAALADPAAEEGE